MWRLRTPPLISVRPWMPRSWRRSDVVWTTRANDFTRPKILKSGAKRNECARTGRSAARPCLEDHCRTCHAIALQDDSAFRFI